MSETATALMDQLLKPPEADRMAIADRLWESLTDEAAGERSTKRPQTRSSKTSFNGGSTRSRPTPSGCSTVRP
jgi:hypothetical protein